MVGRKSEQELLEYWDETFSAYSDRLKAAIRESLPELTRGVDDVVAVALFSDDSGDTLVPTALTARKRAANDEQYPDLVDYLPWVPDEWDLIGEGGDALSALAEELAPLARRNETQEEFLYYRTMKFVWVVDIMAELVREGWFEERYPGANVAFWVSDSDIHEETIIEWVEELNPPERVQRYVDYLRANGA